ncbi:unnamed protein product, partial [Cylicostephanus goldi]
TCRCESAASTPIYLPNSYDKANNASVPRVFRITYCKSCKPYFYRACGLDLFPWVQEICDVINDVNGECLRGMQSNCSFMELEPEANNDAQLTLEEFKEGAKADPSIVHALSLYFLQALFVRLGNNDSVHDENLLEHIFRSFHLSQKIITLRSVEMTTNLFKGTKRYVVIIFMLVNC